MWKLLGNYKKGQIMTPSSEKGFSSTTAVLYSIQDWGCELVFFKTIAKLSSALN